MKYKWGKKSPNPKHFWPRASLRGATQSLQSSDSVLCYECVFTEDLTTQKENPCPPQPPRSYMVLKGEKEKKGEEEEEERWRTMTKRKRRR